jgi:hypothetical protein
VFLDETVPVIGRETGIEYALGYPIAESADDPVRGTGNPSRIGSTPVNIVILQVKYPFRSKILGN